MGTREESLPDALIAADGTKIATTEQWKKKSRPEILDLFREHVYGHAVYESAKTGK